MNENIKIESYVRERKRGNYPDRAKLDRAIQKGLLDIYAGGYISSLPGYVRMSKRQLRNVGGSKLKHVCKRYIRRQNKALANGE